ncbi:MAG TPA: hypothetical protein VJ740_18005, partial [Hyphomicrobiaceae bacterium]|nr:hypothetical protein [Hyphomicrobiaceae bacterium]
MSAAEHDSPEHDAAGKRAAVADLQDRLTQFCRMMRDLRDGLPEQHVAALRRIEQGIGGLAARVSALGEAEARPASIWAAERDADDVWDREQAEALMQAYESAGSEYAAPDRNAEPGPPPVFAPAGAASGEAARDPEWLDARLADITALLQRGLHEAGPARGLAALDGRLEQLEQRLDTLLSDTARATDRDALQLIEAHVGDLAGRVAAIARQLDRLDAMDAKLGELARAFEDQRQAPPASGPSEETVSALVDAAAERAATRVAAMLPAPSAGEARISALESLVQDYVAERRQSEADSAVIVRSIEDALARIAERMDAMEEARPDLAHGPLREHPDPDHHRLAEAYAAGARVLGQDSRLPSLHASDYVSSSREEDTCSSAGLDDDRGHHEDSLVPRHGPPARAAGRSATAGRIAPSRAGLV